MSTVPDMRPDSRDLVLGLDETGMSVARFFRRAACDADFMDQRADVPDIESLKTLWPDANLHLGEQLLPPSIQRVVASPELDDRNPVIQAANKQGVPVVSDIELFMQAASAPTVGITGSNGKSTVANLVAAMCAADGKHASRGGDHAQPALDLLDDGATDWFVLELSSAQLHRTKTLPLQVAVLLNVAPARLDWHASQNEYSAANYRIFEQSRAVVFNADDARAKELAAESEHAIGISLGVPDDAAYGLVTEDQNVFLARGSTLLFAVDQLAMAGRHNQYNALAALAAGELMGLSQHAMLEVLCEFPGLPHRMQRVARVNSVDYINDSKASNVAAAVASIESVNGMLVLIAGGDSEGGDFQPLQAALQESLRAAVLIGVDADSIRTALGPEARCLAAEDMNDAVRLAADVAELNDTVLLAPACASGDQFDGFAERGDMFVAAVLELAA